jgi:putative hydrolase of the HAD superfamily
MELILGNDMYSAVYGVQKLRIKTVYFKSNQGTQEKKGIRTDYNIYNFPELLNAILFFNGQ